LEKNFSKIDWIRLSQNPTAIHVLEKNLSKTNSVSLSLNPNAIHILEKHPEKIEWDYLSSNPNAMHLLEKNQDKIDWNHFGSNPSIFKKVVNYEFLKKRMDIIREELMMKCMHPSRLERFIEMGGDIDDF
jgi:transposase